MIRRYDNMIFADEIVVCVQNRCDSIYLVPGDNKKLQAKSFDVMVDERYAVSGELDYQVKVDLTGTPRTRINSTDYFSRLELYIKSPKFNDPDMWYRLSNWSYTENVEILMAKKDDDGILISPESWEIAFSSETGQVSFLERNSIGYKKVIHDTSDKLTFGLAKKTKKRIPGNAYLGKNGKSVSLGKVWSLKWNRDKDLVEKVEMDLYANADWIEEHETNSSEVLIDRYKKYSPIQIEYQESRLHISTIKRNWVDLGHYLEPLSDDFDIRNYWGEFLDQYYNDPEMMFKPSKKSSKRAFKKLFNLYSLFLETTGNTSSEEDSKFITPEMRETMISILSSNIEQEFLDIYYPKHLLSLDEYGERSYSVKYHSEKSGSYEALRDEVISRTFFFGYVNRFCGESGTKLIDHINSNIFHINILDIYDEVYSRLTVEAERISTEDLSIQEIIDWQNWFRTRQSLDFHEISLEQYKNRRDIVRLDDVPELIEMPHTRKVIRDLYEETIKTGCGKKIHSLSIGSGDKGKTIVAYVEITIDDLLENLESLNNELIEELKTKRFTKIKITNNLDGLVLK